MNTPLRLALVLLLLLGRLTAADAPTDPAARAAELHRLTGALKPQAGEIVLRGGIAKITLPEQLRYLDAKDAATVLTKLWGNPGRGDSLGMLVPTGFDPLARDSWAVIITFEEDGYVKDDDAAGIDYSKLLADMKEGVKEANKAREKEGYEPVALIGWAAPPRYDAAAKKLYWAKELQFGKSAEHTLNYNFRLLGRRGVLVLNAVADLAQLKVVEAATPQILAAVNFQEGHRYADFNGSTDKTATYGLAALVAGGVAAKAGLLKGLWLGILAFKKLIIIALIALAGSFRKIWNSIRGRPAPTPAAPAAPPAP
jgi:uncharacterized membrane-anchored protein